MHFFSATTLTNHKNLAKFLAPMPYKVFNCTLAKYKVDICKKIKKNIIISRRGDKNPKLKETYRPLIMVDYSWKYYIWVKGAFIFLMYKKVKTVE